MLRSLPFILLSLLWAALPAHADINPPEIETSKVFGSRTVYYNVFPSTDLRADIASRYQIAQAGNQVVVNISLRDTGPGAVRSLPATVTGTYSDLIEKKILTFREVRDDDAVYYIAQLRVTNRELLRFDISLQPEVNTEQGETPSPPLIVTFTRRFAVDD